MFTVYFAYKVSMLLLDEAIGMAFGALGIILSIYAWFWPVVEILDAFAITTSIEMMKNRECVNTVIMHQKFGRAKSSFRVYQILKLIRREMIIQFHKIIPDRELNGRLKKQVLESFFQIHNPDRKAQERQANKAPIIRNDQIFTLIRLCGGSTSLNREECFIFMKKIHSTQEVE